MSGLILPSTVSLREVLDKNHLVEAHDDYIVVRRLADHETPDMRELGSAARSPWTSWTREEYNKELRGIEGLRNYDKMRRSDATVRGTLRLVKTPVLAARWFVEPASESTRDKNVSQFIWDNLTKGMSSSWPQTLTETLLMCDFGYFFFEKVFEEKVINSEIRIVWKKLAPRHPMDVLSWQYDKQGGPAGVLMAPTKEEDPPEGVPIGIDKLLVFTFDKEAGVMEGTSVLRSAYQHWYYKTQLYKIDAIQKERHGIGVPVIKLPPNFNDNDRRLANEMGRNLRTNERAHIVLPPNWEIMFAKLEGQPVSALESANHHDMQIQKNILAAFLTDGGPEEEGEDIFLKSTRFIAETVQDVFNKYAIPQLVDFNWSRVGYPTLKARRIGEHADWRTQSFAIRNLIGAGVIRPDDRLEKWMRDEMDLPPVDPETVRIMETPQAPDASLDSGTSTPGSGTTNPPAGAPGAPSVPRPGLPRQSLARNMNFRPGRVGLDRSGASTTR